MREVRVEDGGSTRPAVLVVDDDETMRATLSAILRRAGHRVLQAGTGEEAIEVLAQDSAAVVLMDVQMPGMGGIEALRRIKESWPDTEVIMVSVVREIPRAVESIKLGAFDYITKDFSPGELPSKVDNALVKRSSAREIAYLRSEIDRYAPPGMVMGQTRAMRDLSVLVERVASLPTTILIQGESGTGKELLARHIHRAGTRARMPFVPVNLAAIPDELLESALFGHEKGSFTGATERHYGKFELADGGTLFLDEVGDLKPALQVKLLRVIQEREIERVGGKRAIKVDVRLVVATHRNLKTMVEEGAFREDLFYRLNVVPMRLPPLRARLEDLAALVEHFLSRYTRAFRRPPLRFSEGAAELLRRYPWPGNIRELQNLIERLVATARDGTTEITEVDIPIEFQVAALGDLAGGPEDLRSAVEAFERLWITRTIERTRSRREAARILGIDYSTLKKKLKAYGWPRAAGDEPGEGD